MKSPKATDGIFTSGLNNSTNNQTSQAFRSSIDNYGTLSLKKHQHEKFSPIVSQSLDVNKISDLVHDRSLVLAGNMN